MPSPLLPLFLLTACEPIDADRLLTLVRTPHGEYELAPREVPALHDPKRLHGDLGDGHRGGFLGANGYRDGGRLDVRFDVQGDVAVPHDEDGLVLWSFYAHLSDARDDLTAMGHDVSPLFPMRAIAFNPVSTTDFQAVENAAYAPGTHAFVLFPEMLREGVPLGGNAGVVRHELGHAWFQLLTHGDVHERAPYQTSESAIAVRALNEGFADMVATLSLDDPRFIDASLPMPSRDVTGDASAHPGLYPPEDPGPLELLSYDPYALGTVFASAVWDVREATDDPTLTLSVAVDAVRAWAEQGDFDDVDAWTHHFAREAERDPVAHGAACEALATRFPDVPEPPSCS